MTENLFAKYNGITEYLHTHDNGDVTLESVQDCESVIQGVKEARDRPVGKEWRHVASIPLVFFDKAAKEGWLHDRKKWWAFLNDPDNAAFRVWPGRIGPTKQI